MELHQAYLNPQLDAWRRQVDDALAHCLELNTVPPVGLLEAARFSLLGEAKRVRALLTLAVTHDLGRDPSAGMAAACAIEMVHAASLILDDLPCMDDAERRRNRATTHRAYGQSTAILTAIGLISRAFETLSTSPHIGRTVRAAMTERLSQAIGFDGLTGGQYDDLAGPPENAASDDPIDRYRRKTGVLFGVSLELGAMAAGVEHAQQQALYRAGVKIGVAFQILDDLIDVCGSYETAGKDVQQDIGKTTAVTLQGIPGAVERAQALLAEANSAVAIVAGRRTTTALLAKLADRVIMQSGANSLLPANTVPLAGLANE